MSRTAKHYIPYLYKRLLEFLSPEKSRSLNKQIKTKAVSGDVCERFSKKIQINPEDLIPLATGGFAVKMSCESTISLVLIGSKIKSEEFEHIPLKYFEYIEDFDEALFLILVKDFEQYLNINSRFRAEHIENILDIALEPDYKGHSVKDFYNFYDPIYVVNIASNHILVDEDARGLVIELSSFIPSLLHCKDKEFIDLIKRLSRSKYIDRAMLYDSLTSFYSRHAFLDIYRCLEKLFYFSGVYLLRQEFLKSYSDFNLELDKLKDICESSLLWKRTEKESIVKLFKLVLCNNDGSFDENNFHKIYIKSIFGDLDYEQLAPEKKAEFLASKIYMYRNSLVHHEDKEFRKGVRKLSDIEWQQLTNSVAYFLLAFIQKFDD